MHISMLGLVILLIFDRTFSAKDQAANKTSIGKLRILLEGSNKYINSNNLTRNSDSDQGYHH